MKYVLVAFYIDDDDDEPYFIYLVFHTYTMIAFDDDNNIAFFTRLPQLLC